MDPQNQDPTKNIPPENEENKPGVEPTETRSPFETRAPFFTDAAKNKPGSEPTEGGEPAAPGTEQTDAPQPEVLAPVEGFVEIDELNYFDYTPKKQKPISFRLPKYFILIFAGIIAILVAGGAVYGYSLKETVEKQKEKIRLATQSEAIQAEIRKATADTEALNKAGEVKNIWMPLIERRPSVARFMEKILIVTPNDVKLESLKYEISKANLARTDVGLVLGVVEQTEDAAGYKLQKMRTDLVRYTQYRPDSLNTRYLGTVPINYQGSETKLIRAEATWSFTLDRLNETDLTSVYERLNKTNPIK